MEINGYSIYLNLMRNVKINMNFCENIVLENLYCIVH